MSGAGQKSPEAAPGSWTGMEQAVVPSTGPSPVPTGAVADRAVVEGAPEVAAPRRPLTKRSRRDAGRGEAARPWAARLLRLRELLVRTVGSCLDNRVTGLAAEAAFFALLSVPPLVFALTGAIGYVSERFPPAQVADLEESILGLAGKVLTDDAVGRVIAPTIDEVLREGRFDVMSLGFVLALWSGSRALHVFVDTITIMHGLGGERGIVRTRVLSFCLYLLAMVLGSVAVPLVVLGPRLIHGWLPDRLDWLGVLYWPVVVALCVCFLATLYHVAVPVRSSWSFNLPGAAFSLLSWIGGSFVLRWFLTVTASETRSVFGPLAAPIAVLMWLYLLSGAVLVGAALNASVDRVFPGRAGAGVRDSATTSGLDDGAGARCVSDSRP